MKKFTPHLVIGTIVSIGLFTAGTGNAAFVVAVDLDPVDDGPISPHPNFSFGGDTTTASDSTPSAAVGLGAHSSLFGGNGNLFPDTYVVSYTPGTDNDNYSLAAGALLGSSTGFGTETSSGLTGGVSGSYKVYITVPSSGNVTSTSTATATGDFMSTVVVSGLNLNDGGTGVDLDPGPAFVGGAVNAWYLLGTVDLTAGNTYTMTLESTGGNTFVSQRLAGVMWEPVPEPSSAALLGLGTFVLIGRRRR